MYVHNPHTFHTRGIPHHTWHTKQPHLLIVAISQFSTFRTWVVKLHSALYLNRSSLHTHVTGLYISGLPPMLHLRVHIVGLLRPCHLVPRGCGCHGVALGGGVTIHLPVVGLSVVGRVRVAVVIEGSSGSTGA